MALNSTSASIQAQSLDIVHQAVDQRNMISFPAKPHSGITVAVALLKTTRGITGSSIKEIS
jgi:hypothetical protein